MIKGALFEDNNPSSFPIVSFNIAIRSLRGPLEETTDALEATNVLLLKYT
jgi:hypothetical protein